MHFDEFSLQQKPNRGNSENDEETEDSEVEYPLIDLKTGLKNEIIEKTIKDLKKASTNSKKDHRFRTSEFSHEVIGQNKSVQFELSKAVNYFFSEQEYMIEKMKKAQQKTMEDLKRIHFDRRKQMRITYEYHNEETRQALIKVKEESIFLQKQEELEEAIKRKRMSINKLVLEQRSLLKEISPKLKRKHRKFSIAPTVKDIEEKQAKQLDNYLENDNQNKTKNTIVNTEHELPKSRSFLQAKALEVTKDLLNPRTVEMMSDRHIETIRSTQPIIPIIPINPKPSINESHSVIIQENKENVKVLQSGRNAPDSLEISPENHDHFSDVQESKKFKKIITTKEIMKKHKMLKEKELQNILALPYAAYRRNSVGKIIELDHPPIKKEFKEPSNRDKYKIRKVLGEERNRYQESIINLKKTTENIIQEDIKKKNLLNAPKTEMKKDPIYETKAIGPKHWLKAFVSSNIPDDIDPTSTEAIIYCRYIRAPLKTYSHLPNYLIYHTPL